MDEDDELVGGAAVAQCEDLLLEDQQRDHARHVHRQVDADHLVVVHRVDVLRRLLNYTTYAYHFVAHDYAAQKENYCLPHEADKRPR